MIVKQSGKRRCYFAKECVSSPPTSTWDYTSPWDLQMTGHVLSSPEERFSITCAFLRHTVWEVKEGEPAQSCSQVALRTPSMVLLVCTDLVLSYFSTNFSLGKKKKSRLPENSEALVETFQVFSIRETFMIKSTAKTNHYINLRL